MVRRILFTVAGVLALAGAAGAQERPPRVVTMIGHGTVQATPDRAWVTVGVEARHVQTQPARQQAAAIMLAIQKRLRALGIPDAAMRTSSFNVAHDWAFVQGQRNLRGYVVSNQIEVKVDDIATVAAVVDESIAAGANVIHGVHWDVKNRQTLERQALQQAFADARSRAEVIAAASGSRLGAVHGVHEQRYADVRPMAMRMDGLSAMSEQVGVATNISPGQMDIRATVTVSFLLQSQ